MWPHSNGRLYLKELKTSSYYSYLLVLTFWHRQTQNEVAAAFLWVFDNPDLKTSNKKHIFFTNLLKI